MVFSFSLIMENKKFYSKKYTHTKFELEEINFNNPELFNFLLLKKMKKSIFGDGCQNGMS